MSSTGTWSMTNDKPEAFKEAIRTSLRDETNATLRGRAEQCFTNLFERIKGKISSYRHEYETAREKYFDLSERIYRSLEDSIRKEGSLYVSVFS